MLWCYAQAAERQLPDTAVMRPEVQATNRVTNGYVGPPRLINEEWDGCR
jgi:hypothetical protein